MSKLGAPNCKPIRFVDRGSKLDIGRSDVLRQVCALVILSTLSSLCAIAADKPGSAPIPTQIGAGKRVFVSNMGGECQNFNSPGLNFGAGQPLRHGQVSAAVPTAYEGLYSALKTWGRFELVFAPGDADLVFQIHVVCPSIKEGHPVLELQILDPETRIALWGFSEIADPAELQKNRDANFERALTRLTQDVKDLFSRADSPPVSATK
ncbi:hypothetical protein [Nevskia soli]|uniref:hypothetical protein n=1 Tax=Nevskia soli TaxID=418856 RepID=UPI0015D6F17F|nr:hypothetical protein [Nevskia soli]